MHVLAAADIQPGRVGSRWREQITRQRDARVGPGVLAHSRQRIRHRLSERHAIVQEAIDEGGVGAVLQQPPHQIGEQLLVRTHRRIRPHQRQVGQLPPRFVVQERAHAVQPLELVAFASAERVDGGERVGVVGGELSKEVRRREQPSGAGEIGDVRGGLAGVDGIASQAFQLGALDLGIPIGAFHQAHVDRTAQARKPVDHCWRPLPVGLHGQA